MNEEKKLDIKTLKSMAYDRLAIMENAKLELAQINEEIKRVSEELSKEAKKEAEEEIKKDKK